MTKISVIVPAYNTASYLEECLDSILNQPFRDIELICVNDGSNDSTYDILNNYKSKDNRVIVINQDNKGLGAARNIALSQAKGEYVLFVDSDDFIKENSLGDILYLAESKSLDVLMFKLINFDNDTYEESVYRYFEMPFLKKLVGDKVFNWQMVKNRLFDISVTVPGKLFKRDLIKNIKFPEGIIFEDNLFFINVMLRAKRVYFYEEYLYYRRLRNDSIINSYFNRYTDCITIYDMIEKDIRRLGLYSQLSVSLFNRRCRDIFTRFSLSGNEYKEEYFNMMKENFSNSQRRLSKEGVLSKGSERSLTIFNSAIKSQNYNEFELSINLYDLKIQHDKLKLKNDITKRKYEKQIKKLKKDISNYKTEIDDLKYLNSTKLTTVFKNMLNRFR